jgi:hypothetical protein
MEDSAASCETRRFSEVSERRTRLSGISGKLVSKGHCVATKVNKYDLVSTPDNRESPKIIEGAAAQRAKVSWAEIEAGLVAQSL